MKLECLIALGGGIGALLRYKFGAWVLSYFHGWQFPLATFSVNILGCLLAGVLLGLHEKFALSESVRLFLMVGLLGGFTTFSAFGVESVQLLRRGEYLIASANVLLSVLCGLAILFIALKTTRSL
jgi:CrcB protein